MPLARSCSVLLAGFNFKSFRLATCLDKVDMWQFGRILPYVTCINLLCHSGTQVVELNNIRYYSLRIVCKNTFIAFGMVL